MKALLINRFVKDLRDLKVSDVEMPKPKNSTDVSVKITHAALTHVDVLYAQGLHQKTAEIITAHFRNNKRHVQPPFILGTEFSGYVTVASSSSGGFQPGDRVFGGGLGSYAEHIVVDSTSLQGIPDGWSFAEACAVGSSSAVSYGAIAATGLKPGETILITGASGGLGIQAIQIAKALQAKVIALCSGNAKIQLAKEVGADHVVDYREPGWEDAVKEATDDGKGVHVVYDSIGAVQSSLKCLRYRGRIVLVGFAARNGMMENVSMNRILLKGATITGYRFGEDGRQDPERMRAVWDRFQVMVKDGHIRPILYQDVYEGLDGGLSRGLQDVLDHKTWGRAVVEIGAGAELKSKM